MRNILLTLSICKQDFLGLGHFLLLFKFLVIHLLSLLTVTLVIEKYNLPERGRERGSERKRERERSANTRIQITQQEGTSYHRILYA